MNPSLAKITMPLIDPDIERLVGDSFFHNKVGIAVVVDVPSCYGECLLTRFKCQLDIRAVREMKLYLESAIVQPA